MPKQGRRPNGAGGFYMRLRTWWVRYTVQRNGRLMQVAESSKSHRLRDAKQLLAERLEVERERRGR